MSKTLTRMTGVDQALRIWPVLVGCAINATSRADEAKISTESLSSLSVTQTRRLHDPSEGPALELVGWYCIKHSAPTLNSLVVNQRTKEAGESVVLHNGLTPGQERDNIVSFDGQVVQPPSATALRAIHAEH